MLSLDDRRHAQSFAAEDERRDRNDERLPTDSGLEVNLRQRAGQQLALAIVHVDFDQQGAARGIDGIRGAHQRALKGSSRDIPET